MQIIITGGAGFLGQRLAKALLNSSLIFDELLLVDIVMPLNPGNDKRITCQQVDLSEEDAAKKIINSKTGIVLNIVDSIFIREFELIKEFCFGKKLQSKYALSLNCSRLVAGLNNHILA